MSVSSVWGLNEVAAGNYLQTVPQMALATDQSVFLFCSITVTLTAAMLKRHVILSWWAETDIPKTYLNLQEYFLQHDTRMRLKKTNCIVCGNTVLFIYCFGIKHNSLQLSHIHTVCSCFCCEKQLSGQWHTPHTPLWIKTRGIWSQIQNFKLKFKMMVASS